MDEAFVFTLDYILCSPLAKAVSVDPIPELPENTRSLPTEGHPSDHVPIAAEIEFQWK